MKLSRKIEFWHSISSIPSRSKMKSKLNDALEGYEKDVYELIQISFSKIVKVINECLNQALTTTLFTAENLESSVKAGIKSLKHSCSAEESREMGSTFFNGRKRETIESYNGITTEAIFDYNQNLIDREIAGLNSGFPDFEYSDGLIKPSVEDIPSTKKEHCIFLNENEMSTQEKKNGKSLSKNDDNKYQCEECDYSTPHKTWLETHNKGVHKKIKDFICTHCQYATSQKSHLVRHQNVKHNIC